jgi:hypothetical protein
MRLELILPQLKPNEPQKVSGSPHKGCLGSYFERNKEVDKPLKDTGHRSVTACTPIPLSAVRQDVPGVSGGRNSGADLPAGEGVERDAVLALDCASRSAKMLGDNS